LHEVTAEHCTQVQALSDFAC